MGATICSVSFSLVWLYMQNGLVCNACRDRSLIHLTHAEPDAIVCLLKGCGI